jgi:signal transduction histidine kinase
MASPIRIANRLSIARKGLLLVLVPLLFQVAFAGIVVIVERVHRADRERELQTREVIAASYQILGLMVDAETGMRGYVLTGNPVFLEPYLFANGAVPGQLQRLRRSISGPQTPQIAGLERAARVSLDFQHSNLVRMNSGDREGAIASISQLDGKRRMDLFRAAMQRFIVAEERLATLADARSRAAQTRLYVALAVGTVFDALLALLLGFYFARSISARLAQVTENTLRVERLEPLAEVLTPGDEIALLDARLHAMAGKIVSTQSGLESANRELNAFSYSISHDLRAPVRAVDGYARMLEEDYADGLGIEGGRFVATIRSEARRMGRLIDDLLAFAQLTRADVAVAEVDVGAVVREVVTDVSRQTPNAAEFRIGRLPAARGDRAMLRQVLVNFISNAVKFSRREEKPAIEIGGEPRNGENVYWIRDNGVGFDMRYASKLFGVFQRLHKFDEFEGTGVGLAIVQRVISRHGGRVWAESELGAGASFFFSLPAVAEEQVHA